jgi:hypothetical protein
MTFIHLKIIRFIVCDFSNITDIRTSETIYSSFDLSVQKAPISYISEQSSKTRLLQLIKHTKEVSVPVIKHYIYI